MVVTLTTSTNARYEMAEGTAGEVLNSLDTQKIPAKAIIGSGYNSTTSKYFAIYRKA